MQKFLDRYFFVQIIIVSICLTLFSLLPYSIVYSGLVFPSIQPSTSSCSSILTGCGLLVLFFLVGLLNSAPFFPIIGLALLWVFLYKNKVKNTVPIVLGSSISLIIIFLSSNGFALDVFSIATDISGEVIYILLSAVGVICANYLFFTKINKTVFTIRPILISTVLSILLTVFLIVIEKKIF